MRCFHKSLTGDLIHSDLSPNYFHKKNRKEKECSSFIRCKWSLTTCNAQFSNERRSPKNLERGSSAWCLTCSTPRTRIKWWKRQWKVLAHEERDSFAKAWIACQYTGLYPHGIELRQNHWDIFRLSLCFIRGWEEGTLAQTSGSQSAWFKTESMLRCWIREIAFCL